MSLTLKCTGKDEKGNLTFVCKGVAYPAREFTFTCPEAELDTWCKNAQKMTEICDAPFPVGKGIFDHPIASFALYTLVMSIGGDEDLVGAEFAITANKKAHLDSDGIPV